MATVSPIHHGYTRLLLKEAASRFREAVLPAVLLLLASLVLLPGTAMLQAVASERQAPIAGLRYQGQAQQATYSLREAVNVALRNFPSIQNTRFKLKAAQADITLAKTAYLPNLNLDIQEMRNSQNGKWSLGDVSCHARLVTR